ncbi:hypothetical protein AVEN_49052-1 [Araneus ventricosus]|uniref:Uncharacterized protein n=1 Tax=Araneus ventricosus TaxID=182803 RepID=A0A4Y2HXI6_ARAVE|nr:hypothetical protein AVEN_49052-1 [Araneus ventricosus]
MPINASTLHKSGFVAQFGEAPFPPVASAFVLRMIIFSLHRLKHPPSHLNLTRLGARLPRATSVLCPPSCTRGHACCLSSEQLYGPEMLSFPTYDEDVRRKRDEDLGSLSLDAANISK